VVSGFQQVPDGFHDTTALDRARPRKYQFLSHGQGHHSVNNADDAVELAKI